MLQQPEPTETAFRGVNRDEPKEPSEVQSLVDGINGAVMRMNDQLELLVGRLSNVMPGLINSNEESDKAQQAGTIRKTDLGRDPQGILDRLNDQTYAVSTIREQLEN